MAHDDANTTTTDQLTLQDPTKRYPVISPPEQSLPGTGLDAEMTPKADLGEKSYRGTGRLEGRKALVTGGDSGIGAATAIANRIWATGLAAVGLVAVASGLCGARI